MGLMAFLIITAVIISNIIIFGIIIIIRII